jgi:hypothetical protein
MRLIDERLAKPKEDIGVGDLVVTMEGQKLLLGWDDHDGRYLLINIADGQLFDSSEELSYLLTNIHEFHGGVREIVSSDYLVLLITEQYIDF